MARKQDEGLIQHCVGVRYRVIGSGNLRTIVKSMGSEESELAVTAMQSPTAQLPFRLANFRAQGIQVEFKVSSINEIFVISRLVVYIKPSATGYPQ